MKKLFITGGLGYIGSKLAQEAVSRGYSVLLYDSLTYKQDADTLLKKIEASNNGSGKLEFVFGDTRNLELLQETIEKFKPDFFFQFAELVGIYICNQDPEHTREINFDSSKGVIDMVEKLGIPLIYNSTSSLYGNQEKPGLLKEDASLPEPTDHYCKNKLLIEKHIQEKLKINPDFKVIIFRPATICGVSPRMRIELLPNHFTYVAMDKGVIKVSEPHAYRAEMDIDEMVEAYFKVIEKNDWPKVIYNLGHYNLSKLEVAEVVKSIIPCHIEFVGQMADTRNLQIDSSLFYSDFDFTPKKSFEQTIEDVQQWIQSNLKEMKETNYQGVLNSPLPEWLRLIGE